MTATWASRAFPTLSIQRQYDGPYSRPSRTGSRRVLRVLEPVCPHVGLVLIYGCSNSAPTLCSSADDNAGGPEVLRSIRQSRIGSRIPCALVESSPTRWCYGRAFFWSLA